jgi:hypothetical protein
MGNEPCEIGRNRQSRVSASNNSEYALILVLVAVVVIAALTIMGPMVRNVFDTINSSL